MAEMLRGREAARLERSCRPRGCDWIRFAPAAPGIERIEAYFAGHAYAPHRHDSYAVGFTLSGVQSFDYRGARADSTAGKAIVLHPDELHDGRAGAESGFRYRMAYVAPRLIAEALGSGVSLPFVRSPVLEDARIVRALALVLADLEQPLEELQADAFIAALADALSARDGGHGGRRGGVDSRAVERARLLLEARAEESLPSATLEAESGLDRYSLARHFRRRLGTSPYRYLVLRRLDRARSLIAAGDGLAEAALASGFADQSHMTRHFKRAYGLSPGQWRRLHQAAAG